MPYAEGRTFYDADSHFMELPEWLPSYADPMLRARIPSFSLGSTGSRERVAQMIARGRSRAGDRPRRRATRPPSTHSITHPCLHPMYAMLEEAGVPLFFHVEGEAPRKVASGFSENGWEGQTDFHGGGENFTGLLYMAVSQWMEIALAAMIFDQVLEKFPRLKIGVIELGAVWVPAWLERMEIVKHTFGRTESRIRDLKLCPADHVRRQVRVMGGTVAFGGGASGDRP